MKIDLLKKVLKEAVREAIQEELKDILLEAIKSPKTIVQETYTPVGVGGYGVTNTQQSPSSINPDLKRNLKNMIGGEFDTTFSANSSHAQPAYTPPPVNTVGEGSSLPGGEVSLDQIMGLMK
jgi:hypothetical protein